MHGTHTFLQMLCSDPFSQYSKTIDRCSEVLTEPRYWTMLSSAKCGGEFVASV